MSKQLFIMNSIFALSLIGSGLQADNGNRTEEIRQLPVKETVADFRGVAKTAIPAVVSIHVKGKKKSTFFDGSNESADPFDSGDIWDLFGFPRGNGAKSKPIEGQASGFIVKPDGYILTNSHVVHGMDVINVQLHDGREFSAKVLGEDPNSDVAFLKIDADNLPYLTLGNSDELDVGQWVAAIGNPFGLQATLTVGVVSAKGRNNLDIVPAEDFIQTDASINRGNSGGPLVTLNGEVAGINTAIATTGAAGYMGIGFAIPSNMAKRVMEEILTDGKVSHGFAGVTLQSIDYDLAKAFDLKKVEGALVTSVSKDSPAAKAGLQVEDIIIAYDGRSFDNAAALRSAIYMMKPGTKIVLTVLRKNQEIKVPIELGDISKSAVVASTAQSKLGIEVENLTSDLARSLGYGQENGVVITKIAPNSVAALAGLKKGALIMAVNRQKVENTGDFKEALQKSEESESILLQVRQGDGYFFLSLKS